MATAEGSMNETDCEHEWDDPRPTRLDGPLPPSHEQDVVMCKKCQAPLLLPPRNGIWVPENGVEGPPYVYREGGA